MRNVKNVMKCICAAYVDSRKKHFEPPHDKTNKMTFVPSKDSDQPKHPPSLIRVFAVRSMGSLGPSLLQADSADSDPKPHPVDGMISQMIFDSVNVAKCL